MSSNPLEQDETEELRVNSQTPFEILERIYQEAIGPTLWLRACIDVLADGSHSFTEAQRQELLHVANEAFERLEDVGTFISKHLSDNTKQDTKDS